MIQKNQEYIGIVEDMGMNGEGVIKNDGITVFVPFAIAGEKIKYKILKASGRVAYAKLLEVFTPAEERVRPKCPVFSKCGGCDLQHVKYIEQLKIKENKIKNCFKKIAFTEVNLKPSVKSDLDFRYRNKLQLPVGETENGTAIGFYALNSHRIVPVTDCLINPEWTASIISSTKKFMEETGLKGYNELTGSGDIREITVKEIRGALIITAVILGKSLRKVERFVEILKEELKCEFSLFINHNDKKGNFVYGDEFTLVYGKETYSSEMLGIKYKTGVRSFSQVNTSVCEKLYSAVNSLVEGENITVIDAYSGAGLMTALLSKKANKAIGIEIVKEAVQIADELAEENGLKDKITNYNGKCEDILPDVIRREKEAGNDTVIVLDPPRKGCDLSVINAVKNSGADKVIYVSCKPSTFARDVGLLIGTLEVKENQIVKAEENNGTYNIDFARAFDMFPQTKHVETLLVLSHK